MIDKQVHIQLANKNGGKQQKLKKGKYVKPAAKSGGGSSGSGAADPPEETAGAEVDPPAAVLCALPHVLFSCLFRFCSFTRDASCYAPSPPPLCERCVSRSLSRSEPGSRTQFAANFTSGETQCLPHLV